MNTDNEMQVPLGRSDLHSQVRAGGRSPDADGRLVMPAFSFGSFRVVPRSRRLERDGIFIAIGGRAFDLLCILASRSGEVVSKSELMARAWPDVAVEETSLRFHIRQLRRALGDDQLHDRYIVNIAGRGYCFVAVVGD